MDDLLLRAILAGIGVALVAGPLGAFVVWRRMAYFGDTMAHSAFLGIALGFLLHINVLIGTFAVAVAIALSLGLAQRQKMLATDTLLGLFAHGALAFGLVGLAFLEGVRVDLMGYLFGDILAVGRLDLFWIYGGGAAALIALAVIWRQLLSMTIHEELAQVEGVPVERLRILFMVLIALVIVVALKIVGILLITAMLIIPAATARRFVRNPEPMAVLAAVLGALAVVGGISGSFLWDTPSGPSIAATAFVIFAASLLVPMRSRPAPSTPKPALKAGLLGLLLLAGTPALAHEGDDRSPDAMHFLDTLIGETPTPETSLRLDHLYRDRAAGDEHTLKLTVEYAVNDWIGLELGMPYAFLDPDGEASRSNVDVVEIGIKFVPFVFPSQNLVVGGGLELGLPTGDESKEIGSNRELEIEPFLSAGWHYRGLQTTAILKFGIPTNQTEEEAAEEDLEIGFNLAFLYPLTPAFAPVLEFDGESVAKGTDNETVINVTGGFLARPFENDEIALGFGVSAPLTSDEDFDVRTIFSIFYEF
ncbi:MAG: metal ABC transporter permease [Alphaproteobacteria bacterium]|nr:metal ABC transporter permease [Alphaproteobacteria bacterium]